MRAVADRGLQAYAVPSARAGQQTDPAARRDALAGLMTGGFLLAVIATVLAIIVAAPQYAEPATESAIAPVASADPSAQASLGPVAPARLTTSDPPTELKGYRWPVYGGQLAKAYQVDAAGRFVVRGERVHDGIVITWSEGAPVKAAHAGTVVAAGPEWVKEAGYLGPVDEVLARFEQREKKLRKKGQEPDPFPLGIVIDDGNGYSSVYTELKDLRVKKDDVVKAGQTIAGMARAEGKQMMRYRLVRMDGPDMKVHGSDRKLGYPKYAAERVDPLAVLKLDARKMPQIKVKLPKNPPKLSDDY